MKPASELSPSEDPSVTKLYESVPLEENLKDFYQIADAIKIGLLSTKREGLGSVSRSMAIAKRAGPDFLFLANINSQKFKDINENKAISLHLHDSSTQNWACVAGEAHVSNSDPRIKDIYSPFAGVWFGKIDEKYDGTPDDPRMALIELKTKYITYYKSKSGTIGKVKEYVGSMVTGDIPDMGSNREIKDNEITKAREM